MKLLLETTFEYGWRREQPGSWGANWHRPAIAEAQEQIRNHIANMVNLKELETFTKKDAGNGFNLDVTEGKDSSGIKIGTTDNKNEEEKTRMVKENYLLVDISDVYIKPGTDWSKTDKNWKQERSWKASAIMICTLRIYGEK